MRPWQKYLPLGGFAAVLAGALLAVTPRSYVVQVLGTALWLVGCTLLARWLWPLLDTPVRIPWRSRSDLLDPPPWTWQQLLGEAAGPVIILGVLAVLYWPLLGGQMPWQADHTVHQWKAWLLSERLLPSGRLMGWTHQSGTGYPAEVLYPPLGDLWLAVVRYGTLKQLSWEATYALGFFGVLAFCTLTFYHLGRRFFGPVAGLAAAFFVLTDLGGFREGGFIFTVQYGVWPLHLGITLAFLALLKFHDLLRTPGWQHLLRCGLAVAAALLAHPVTLIFFLVALPLYWLLAWLRRAPGQERVLGRALAGVALGCALAAFWLLPFFAKAADFSAHVTNQWKSISDIAGGVISGQLWRNAWSWPLVLGALGGVVALRERRALGGYLFALSGVLLLAGSLTAYNELRLANWIASARFVQFQRFVIFVKLSWFLLAGFLLQRVLVGLPPTADDAGPRDAPWPRPESGGGAAAGGRLALRRAGLLVTACLVIAPFVLPLSWRLVEDRILPVGQLTTVRGKGPFLRDFRALLAEVCKASRQPGAKFFRLGYVTSFNDHELANGATYCGVPEAKLSFIPSETFKYRAHLSPAAVPSSREDYRALNVRFLLVNGSRPAPSWARQLRRRGRLALYEIPDYQPERYTVLRRVSEGTPRFERVPSEQLGLGVTFSDEEIRVRARDVPPDHYLVLHVAHFANWRAYRGDTPLHIRPYNELAPKVKGLMMVPLRSGVTVFRYETLWVDWLGRLLSLLAVVLVIFIVVARRRTGLAQWVGGRLEPWVNRLAGAARWSLLAGGVLAVLFVLAKATGVIEPKAGPRSLTHEISDARVAVRLRNGKVRECSTFQLGRWICGKGRRWVGPVAEEWNLLNRFGLWAHPDEAGTLMITFPKRLLGKALEIDYGVLQSGGAGAPVTLDVFLGSEKVGQVSWPRRSGRAGWAPRPLRIDTGARRGRRVTVRFEVHTTHIGGRHFAFDARILP
ncbi:MAG: hypothetical protein ABI333_13285 [bacterium]